MHCDGGLIALHRELIARIGFVGACAAAAAAPAGFADVGGGAAVDRQRRAAGGDDVGRIGGIFAGRTVIARGRHERYAGDLKVGVGRSLATGFAVPQLIDTTETPL